MPKKSETARYSDDNSIQKSIRFPKDEYQAFKKIADGKGMPVTRLIRNCAVAHIKNMGEHEELMESFQDADPEVIQQNFFDTLNRSNDVTLKTLTNIGTDLRKKINTMDGLQRKTLYALLYFLQRELPQEEKDARQINAKKTMKTLLEDLDKETS
ncbi:MAG: hypothetical protein KGJ11_00850 [Candidatus Omnitrophica bacterium]|nr:hypothetical protein [Candidatus Omnitrophota bacterium]